MKIDLNTYDVTNRTFALFTICNDLVLSDMDWVEFRLDLTRIEKLYRNLTWLA